MIKVGPDGPTRCMSYEVDATTVSPLQQRRNNQAEPAVAAGPGFHLDGITLQIGDRRGKEDDPGTGDCLAMVVDHFARKRPSCGRFGPAEVLPGSGRA